LLTPGIYALADSLVVTRPDTVILGLGFPSLVPAAGQTALRIEAAEGVIVSGLVVDAGAIESAVLVQVGLPGRRAGRGENPIWIHDLVCRVGGYGPGRAKVMVEIHGNYVGGENLWLWRADHGANVGWTENPCDTGLLVAGDDVPPNGHFLLHSVMHQKICHRPRALSHSYTRQYT